MALSHGHGALTNARSPDVGVVEEGAHDIIGEETRRHHHHGGGYEGRDPGARSFVSPVVEVEEERGVGIEGDEQALGESWWKEHVGAAKLHQKGSPVGFAKDE